MYRNLLIFISLLLFFYSSEVKSSNFTIYIDNGVATLKKDGEDFFIKGIGGTNRMSLAASLGANAFRTWDVSVEKTAQQLEDAKKNNMYIMMGFWLSHDKSDYFNEAYKNAQRKRILEIVEEFKDHPNMMIWCLGNEVNLEGADIKEAWEFINELALLIKKLDTDHPVATVVSHSKEAINNVARYAPDIDVIGFNSYASIVGMKELFDTSLYKGAYIVSEWGPTGHWEGRSTGWNAPIEPSSEEKRIEYEERYTSFIENNDRCLGSFVFLWGQKQERTPTWYGMFVESNVEGLPLNGELCPTVESMEKVWTGKEPSEKAPVIKSITIKGISNQGIITLPESGRTKASVFVSEPNGDDLTYVWEVLEEATELGIGGSYVREGVEIKHTRYAGTGVRSAYPKHLDEYPYRLEYGTLNLVGVAGLYAL